MPLRAFESQVNSSVLKHLANATVTIAGGDVPGIFSNAGEVAQLGIGLASTGPQVMVESSAVMDDPVGQAILVNGAAFEIDDAQPDGAGFTNLVLLRAS